jgi:hypothetical protein
MLDSLKKTAEHEGHALGIYYTLAEGGEKNDIATYIHSKLIIVDDTFLSVGSANATNRSMGLDTELNVSWEAEDESDHRLRHSIKNVYISLLAEHAGLTEKNLHENFSSKTNIVDSLDAFIDEKLCRLRKHTMQSIFGDSKQLKDLRIDTLSFDPEKPIIEEDVYEILSKDSSGIFTQGITFLNEKIISKSTLRRKKSIIGKLVHPFSLMRIRWVLFSSIAVLLVIILLIIFRYFSK